MTLREKVNEIHGKGEMPLVRGILFRGHSLPVKAGGCRRLNIPTQLFTDGPRGVTCTRGTCFPVTIARGATWDVDLERRVGDVMGCESRAAGANYSGAVCINVLRNPLWGRSQETYGEDPWLLGEMGAALISGLQFNHVDACIKHFAANSMENNRYAVNVKMDERTLREVYLPQFKKCIARGAMSVMSSYNQLNGCYNGQNKYLLNEILRKEWGFKGYVTSDWDNGIYDGEQAIKAGMNVEMSGGHYYSYKNIKKLLNERRVTEAEIDSLVLPVIRTKIQFACNGDTIKYTHRLIACKAHVALAREVAEKSAVLLKNDNHLLPFNKNKIKKIAVLGTLAKSKNTGDRGSSWVRNPRVVSALQGIRNYFKNMPVKILTCRSRKLDKVKQLSKEADAVVVVSGLNYHDEGEFISTKPKKIRDPKKPEKSLGFGLGIVARAGDKTNLKLKNADLDVIKTASSVNDKVAVALVSGGPVTVEEWIDEVPGILQVFYSGMQGGNALARLLFGDVNPSGRLPFLVPKNEDDLPAFNSYAKEADYGYYHGYTLFDKKDIEPRFPFGYGLSYTSFNFTDLRTLTPVVKPGTSLKVSVEVENTGTRPGAEVAQLYIGFAHSQVDRPVKILRGFRRVYLKPGEKTTIFFEVKPEDLAYYNPQEKGWEVENMSHEIYVGSSSSLHDLQKSTFEVSDFKYPAQNKSTGSTY